jgi:hypothetical protein
MLMQRWFRVAAATLAGLVLLLLTASQGMALQVGDKAPPVSLAATTAEKIELASYLGKQPVVLFFYIGAFTRP